MNYALSALWHDKSRYLPGVVAVGFSAVLISLQFGLLIGLFSVTSIPIDHARADIWVGSPKVLSVDLGKPIPQTFISRIGTHPGIDSDHIEYFYQSFATWTKSNGGSDLCMVTGSKMTADDMGTFDVLTPEQRVLLTQPASVIIDASEMERLGVGQVGDYGEINKQRVQVVGTVRGFKGLAGPYVWCSAQTARGLLRVVLPADQCTYILAKCKDPADAPRIAKELEKQYAVDSPESTADMSVFTKEDFAYHSKMHWLTKTKAGIAIGFAALLGLLVGMVVTGQTLHAATLASAREFAILLALGIPRWRISLTVLNQSFWVGIVGVSVSFPTVYGLKELAKLGGANVQLPLALLATSAVLTLGMAVFAGLIALRSVRKIEPMSLLR